jgi:hypothetical protein
MDRSDASALADLQMHWDEAYVIGLDGDIWSARYRTSTDELRAHTSTELRELIRSDYTYRQKACLPASARDDDDDEHDDQDEFDDEDQGEDEEDEGEDEEDEGEDERGDAAQGDAAPVRQRAEHVTFAAIRGERMST